jgi:thiamine biosynthesis lipoprotein
MQPNYYHKLPIAGLIVLLLLGCHRDINTSITISGKAQGTSYNITYLAGEHSNYRQSIDSIFRQIDRSLSTYDSSSLISKINRNEPAVAVDRYFSDVFHKSMEVSEKTDGLFDITVAPVVNVYGFGFKKRERVTSGLIDSLLRFVGYKKVRLADNKVVKEMPQVMLDFNAIAQGYTVDVLASFLEGKGIRNYMVEVGGELRAKGRKLNDSSWTVGIEMPSEDEAEAAGLYTRVRMDNKSLATSGNYKKFYVEDGKKYAHIINPFNGYPAKNNLLSTTVIANDCMTADAYATAFMVMGVEKAKEFLVEHKELGLEVFFIYDENGVMKTFATKYFEENRENVTM